MMIRKWMDASAEQLRADAYAAALAKKAQQDKRAQSVAHLNSLKLAARELLEEIDSLVQASRKPGRFKLFKRRQLSCKPFFLNNAPSLLRVEVREYDMMIDERTFLTFFHTGNDQNAIASGSQEARTVSDRKILELIDAEAVQRKIFPTPKVG